MSAARAAVRAFVAVVAVGYVFHATPAVPIEAPIGNFNPAARLDVTQVMTPIDHSTGH